ncbi:hypothetical protein IC582_028944 [Cucumis melo]
MQQIVGYRSFTSNKNKPVEILPQRLSSEEACLLHALDQYHGTICTWFTGDTKNHFGRQNHPSPCNQEIKLKRKIW